MARKIRFNRYFYKHGRAWRSWISDANVLWIFLGVLIAACLLGDWLGYFHGYRRQESIVISGLFLEISGVLSVAIGFSRKLRHFGADSVRARLQAWLLRCPFFAQDSLIEANTAEKSLMGMDIAAYEFSADFVGTDKERIARLEHNILGLRDLMHQVDTNLQARIRETHQKLKDQLGQVESDIESVRATSAKAVTNDVGMEIVGLGWVIVGLVFATVPQFIEYSFGWLIRGLTLH